MHEGGDPQPRAGIARWYGYVEDGFYVGLGLLLSSMVILLLVSCFIQFGKTVLDWSIVGSVSGLLDQILLILLLVELLYTVQISFREHALLPEPFLLVGLISVIRRVLVLTFELGEKHQAGARPPQALIAELAVLAALILALATAFVLLRKHASAQPK